MTKIPETFFGATYLHKIFGLTLLLVDPTETAQRHVVRMFLTYGTNFIWIEDISLVGTARQE